MKMTKNLFFRFVFLICIYSCKSQDYPSNFNLDFEEFNVSHSIPDNWIKWGTPDYTVNRDSLDKHSGKYSAVIFSGPNIQPNSFGSIAYRLPANYSGKEITLEGFMKIKEVKNGFAGLMLRIDGKDKLLEFDNMQRKHISGTHDWKKYTITVAFHENAKQVFVGGLLTGEGRAWFDGFEVSIDGESIDELIPVAPKLTKAELDRAFDNGSEIDIDTITTVQLQNLHQLGKVWGFIKYHHPEIAAGNFNWDYELFRILPEILNSINRTEAKQVMHHWIKNMGSLDKKKEKYEDTPNMVKLNPNTDWIEQDTSKLGNVLKAIHGANRPEKHYYIDFAPNVGNPIFKNESSYKNMSYTDEGLKLLSLYRYWNIIAYFFPYRYLMEENWDAVLLEFIPKILKANDERSYKLILLELIGKIQDTHANIWQNDTVLNEFWGQNIAPIAVQFVEGKVVVTKVYDQLSNRVDLAVGDVLTQVNGKDVMDLMEEKIKYCPASNTSTQLRDVAKKILRTNQKDIDLTFEQKGEINVTCVNFTDLKLQNPKKTSHKLLNSNIGYIYPGSLKPNEINQIMDNFFPTKGLIIDLRCYPSDFIVFSLSQYLLSEPTEFAKFTTGGLHTPGQFLFTKPLKVGKINRNPYQGKVVIIVNEMTQSQAEYSAMAFRVAPKATVIGSTTAGADGNVSEIFLPGNIRTMISGIGVYYPDGTETQRIGIVPNVEIKPTIKGIAAGKDELLDYAITLIDR